MTKPKAYTVHDVLAAIAKRLGHRVLGESLISSTDTAVLPRRIGRDQETTDTWLKAKTKWGNCSLAYTAANRELPRDEQYSAIACKSSRGGEIKFEACPRNVDSHRLVEGIWLATDGSLYESATDPNSVTAIAAEIQQYTLELMEQYKPTIEVWPAKS
jgi:hypothetical protein